MKIAVVSANVFTCPPPGYSGLEMIAWQVAKGLAERGHQVALFAPQGSSCPGCSIIPTGPPGQWDERTSFSQTWQYYLNFDCVIDHTWNKYSTQLKVEGRLKAPVLQVMHAPVDTMMQELPPFEKPCFVCISQDQADHFEACFSPDNHKKNRVLAKVAHNGIDMDFYHPLDVPRTWRYLFLARFSTIKGPDIAIDVCRKAGVGLDLIGDTSITNEPHLYQLCMNMADSACHVGIEYGLRGREQREDSCYDVEKGRRIRMVGAATRGECVYWFSQAHALLHPNLRFREPLGLAPLESMACGSPCIAFDNGAMRETIKEWETGFLVDTVDEMETLVRENAVGSIDRKRCRDWVGSKFTLKHMVDRYETLCQEALAGGW